MNENQLSREIIAAAIEVHRILGPGLLESVYEEALWYELAIQRGFFVERQKCIPAVYKDRTMEVGFRADLIVELKVVVELKSITQFAPVHPKILLTYLRLTDIKLGLLLNFNEALMKNGIKRVVNNL